MLLRSFERFQIGLENSADHRELSEYATTLLEGKAGNVHIYGCRKAPLDEQGYRVAP